ncbi:MAG: DUF484 family protein [Pseudomonadota bacterium]
MQSTEQDGVERTGNRLQDAAVDPTDESLAETAISDAALLGRLRADPNFFQRHPELLSELNLPHDSGQAISLIERQVAILRERNMQMRRRMNEMIQTAQANDALFAKTRTLTLELLNVDSWHELNEVLATYVLADFQADFVCCHLMHLPVYLDHLASHEADPPYERFLPGDVPVCTMLRAEELAGLFPVQNHEQDGSAVLVPLRWEPGEGEGCLAIGSRTTNRFASDMDTLFVTYIGEVLGRVITRLAT